MSLSGGMRQRVMIAMALVCEPRLLIADEPTTALDVTIQAQIMDLLLELGSRTGTAILFITHNLGLVAESCARMLTMYAGQVVEDGPVEEILSRPFHPYTAGPARLAAAIGQRKSRLPSIPGRVPSAHEMPAGCRFAPRCTYAQRAVPRAAGSGAGGEPSRPLLPPRRRSLCRERRRERGNSDGRESRNCLSWPRRGQSVKAVDRCQLCRAQGRDLRHHRRIRFGQVDGRPLRRVPAAADRRHASLHFGKDPFALSPAELRKHRRSFQIIFQDPNAALDPRMTILESVREPLDVAGIGTREERTRRALAMLDRVALAPDLAYRYPHEISGGQKQRANIARALVLEPTLIVCDEVVAALDVSIQADMLNLFADLQREFNLTYVFISHDLRVVAHVSDRVAVMYFGKIVELGPAGALMDAPLHPYTQALLSAEPEPVPARLRNKQRIILKGEIPSALDPPSGCRFHTRCPIAVAECSQREPEWREIAPDRFVACHFAAAAVVTRHAAGCNCRTGALFSLTGQPAGSDTGTT